jgi:signal transduction histidine kinase/CHASE1-domain containing sensor protein
MATSLTDPANSTQDQSTPAVSNPTRTPTQHAVLALAIAVAYFVFGKLGLLLAIPPGYATAIWPSSGIALGALLIFGIRFWPAVWLGSFVTNVVTSYNPDAVTDTYLIAAIIGSGAAAQAMLGAKLIRRYVDAPMQLIRERDIMMFFVLAGPVTHVVNATFSTTTLLIAGAIPSAALTANWWTWWTGDTIGALICTPLMLMWFSSDPIWTNRRVVVTLPLLGTMVAAIAIFVYTSRAEWRELQAQFGDDVDHLVSAVSRRIEINVELVHAMGAFLSVTGSVDKETFIRYTELVLSRHPELRALEWAPRVAHTERAAYEQSMRDAGTTDFTIRELAANSSRPAQQRDDYFPMQWLVPSRFAEVGAGFDIASEPIRRAALELALQTRNATATAPIELVIAPGKADGTLLVSPVFENHSTSGRLLGYAVGAIHVPQLLDAALSYSPIINTVSVSLADVTGGVAIPIHAMQPANLNPKDTWSTDHAFEISRSIEIADRMWRMTFKPTLQYLAGHTPITSWLVLVGGLVFTALIGAGALLITGRQYSVANLVSQRTRELAKINETLAEEICDHLNTEYALEKERESLNTVLNNLHEGILVLDRDGMLQIANGAAVRMHAQITGIELTHLSQPSPFKLFNADGHTPLADEDAPPARALRGETVADYELVAQGKARPALSLMVTAHPLTTSDGQQHGAIVVVRDITESKKIERLKAEFVAVVSHELRTPITSIRGSLGLLAGGAVGPLPEKSKQLLDIALRNSDRLAHLINDLLDIEKMESGKMNFELAEQPLLPLLEQSLEANSGYAQQFNVRFTLQAHSSDARCLVDAHRFLQVMANLLSNAAKFSPTDGEVIVTLDTLPGSARICVQDKGPGIPEEFWPRIFQKFSQADSSDTRAKSGTGLGLAICKAIVERMGGTIGFDTESGKGTTFWFELPRESVETRDAGYVTRDTRRETR